MNIHEETLKIARNLIKKDPNLTDWVISKFPELKEDEESGDEIIRKSLSAFFAKFRPNDMWDDYFSFGDIVAWFEKQGGQPKEATYTHEVETGNGNIKSLVTEKVQLPKFKVGDWVVYECGEETATLQIARIVGKTYVFSDGTTLSVADEDTLRLWDINKDAKVGDVLYAKGSYFKEYVFVFSSFTEDNVISTHFGYDIFHGTFDKKLTRFGRKEDFISVTPATKEQRDLLFQKMKEAGYEWDSENRELKKIDHKELTDFQERLRGILIESNGKYDDNTVIRLSGQVLELVEQKPEPAWSKEDEKIYQSIMDDIVQENQLDDKQTDWLKSLKDKYTWKPTEEQIICLQDAISNYQHRGYKAETLETLLKQLKQL